MAPHIMILMFFDGGGRVSSTWMAACGAHITRGYFAHTAVSATIATGDAACEQQTVS